MRDRVPSAPAQWIDELHKIADGDILTSVQGRSILDMDNHGQSARITTGVPGLDNVLHGGFLTGRSYLVSGGPGAGKTTLGLHFLAQARPGDGLLITLGEAHRNIRGDAASIGIDLDHIVTIDVSPAAPSATESVYTMLEPWEAEPPDLRSRIAQAFAHKVPARVFIDSLNQLQDLVPDAFQFRKQVMALLEYLNGAGATVVFSAERGSTAEQGLQYLGDGIITLETSEFGRALSVVKFRGSGFAEGRHSVRLTEQGMCVYPRLVPTDHSQGYTPGSIPSGIAPIDTLTGGGLERGTVTILSGPTGVGKTSLGVQFMHEAAKRAEPSVIFSFEERQETLRHRCEGIGIPLGQLIDGGSLAVREVEPLRYGPDEFAWQVRREVEKRGVRMVMLDSLSGYRQSIHGEDPASHVHALCRYLTTMGVTVLLVNEAGSIAGGELRVSECGISYLSDTVVLLRYIELNGELRKTIGVLKKRTGDFEKTLRELRITGDGLSVGEPLSGLRGILRGVPESAAGAVG